MAITKDDVKYIAKLAKLRFDDASYLHRYKYSSELSLVMSENSMWVNPFSCVKSPKG